MPPCTVADIPASPSTGPGAGGTGNEAEPGVDRGALAGYHRPHALMTGAAMRPSATLNGIIDGM